jgi:hypothetical protein
MPNFTLLTAVADTGNFTFCKKYYSITAVSYSEPHLCIAINTQVEDFERNPGRPPRFP